MDPDTPREASAVPSSGGDTIDDQLEDPRTRLADLDSEDLPGNENSLTNVTPSARPIKRGRAPVISGRKRPKKGSNVWINEGLVDGTEDEGSVASASRRKQLDGSPGAASGTAVGTRRQANGTIGSVYSGSKNKHLKKEDGAPMWRTDIQHEFLRLVVEDTTPVFTNLADGKKECNFADIYIDCMARSSKCSKVLKDRLQVDRQAAQNMAMICLLVNVGRMNTTLNFFPEMRAQLRTYHSIPSLQAYKSQRDYKSLQDAPRLKSILKGASEDEYQPRSVSVLKEKPVPRTNPVNLLFVIAQFAPKVSETHFLDQVDFFDLLMRKTITSKSRAQAFLWLMWWYLESDFTKEAALNNPFGAGQYQPGEDPGNPNTVPQIVPDLIHITDEEGEHENVDTQEEKDFAEKMSKERKRIMAENATEPPLTMADPGNPDHKVVKRLKKSMIGLADDDSSVLSDVESRASPGFGRSPVPEMPPQPVLLMSSALGAQADSLDDEFETHDPHPGRGRYKRVRGKNTPSRSKANPRSSEAKIALKGTRPTGTPEYHSTPQPPQSAAAHPIISRYGAQTSEPLKSHETPTTAPKPRARTHYQRELEEHKNKRIDWAVRRRRKLLMETEKHRRDQHRWLLQAARRINELDATYDSEEEDMTGDMYAMGGIHGKKYSKLMDDNGFDENVEPEDYGEESEMWLKVLKRTRRRLNVWDGQRDIGVYNARISTRYPGAINGVPAGDTPRKAMPHPVTGVVDGKTKQEIDQMITADLLAERSDESMADEESAMEVDREEEEGSDIDMEQV